MTYYIMNLASIHPPLVACFKSCLWYRVSDRSTEASRSSVALVRRRIWPQPGRSAPPRTLKA